MCEFCDMTSVNLKHACDEYFIHKSFGVKNDETKKTIKAGGDNPVMYLREYRNNERWSAVCEFADESGTVIETPVVFCPKCGRKLKQSNKRKGEYNGRERQNQD